MTKKLSEEQVPHWKQPSHPTLFKVTKGTGDFSTKNVALQDIAKGKLVTKMDAATPSSYRSYATVQTGKNSNIELNSDLLYCNHSCNPSVVFDTEKMEVRVSDDRDLKKGDEVTFFYPSTEWDMSQPFQCNSEACAKNGNCVGMVQGAKHLNRKTLVRFWLNKHIQELLADQGHQANGVSK